MLFVPTSSLALIKPSILVTARCSFVARDLPRAAARAISTMNGLRLHAIARSAALQHRSNAVKFLPTILRVPDRPTTQEKQGFGALFGDVYCKI
ncbi:hypothetical protein AB0758_33365 [Tolypothrix bouteillei VB521301_2]|uniref:hypothetical protein n=2 Tax=Nostocales TaxID=1161 RepID=UPI0038B55028